MKIEDTSSSRREKNAAIWHDSWVNKREIQLPTTFLRPHSQEHHKLTGLSYMTLLMSSQLSVLLCFIATAGRLEVSWTMSSTCANDLFRVGIIQIHIVVNRSEFLLHSLWCILMNRFCAPQNGNENNKWEDSSIWIWKVGLIRTISTHFLYWKWNNYRITSARFFTLLANRNHYHLDLWLVLFFEFEVDLWEEGNVNC